MKNNGILLILIIFFYNISCSKDNIEERTNFEIYSTRDNIWPIDTNINDVELDKSPLINSRDIKFYDFSAHTIFLNKSRYEIFKNLMDDDHYFTVTSTPFVVVASKQNIYLGSLFTENSNLGMDNSYRIYDHDYFPSDILNISYGNLNSLSFNYNDFRSDERIRQALKNDGIYREGISVKLDTVNIIENNDTSTIQYQFTITNNEQNELLIADPLKIGYNIFNEFNLGVILISNDQIYYAEFIPHSLEYLETFNEAWYTKLSTGESISRSVEVTGYPNIPPGNYSCFYRYVSPTNIENSINEDGSRYWIGWINSDILVIEIN